MANGVFRNGDQILRDPEGQLVRVDPAKASELLNTGVSGRSFSPVTEEEVAAAERAKENQTLSGKAETALLGAAENIADTAQTAFRIGDSTFGKVINPLGILPRELVKNYAASKGVDLTDPSRSLAGQLLGATIDPNVERQYAERTRELQQANPGAWTAGEVLGGVTTGLVTGGLSGAIGEAATGALAKAGAKQALSRAGGAALSMGLEGGFYGAAQTETNARLQGKTTGASAEELLQGIGLGALLGGGIGAAGSLTMSAFRKLVNAPDSVAARGAQTELDAARAADTAATDATAAFGKAGTKEGDDALAKLQSTLSGANRETLEKYGPHKFTPEAIEGREMWKNRTQLIEEAVPRLTKSLDQMDEAIEAVTTNVKQFELKKAGVQRMLEGVDLDKAKSFGISSARAVEGNLSDLMAEIGPGKLTESVRKRIENAVTYTKNHLDSLDVRSSAAEVYVANDFIKRELQAVEKSLQFTATHTQDGTTREAAMKALRKIEDEIQEPFRKGLESERIWGQAGMAQREINAKWKPFIDSSGRYGKELTVADGGKVWADGRQKYYADSAKVQGWIEGIGTARGQTAQEIVRARIESAQGLLETISKYHPLDTEQAEKLALARKGYEQVKEELTKLDKTVRVANEIEDVARAERDTSQFTSRLGVGGRVVGTITGTLAAGPMGGAMGLSGMLNRPASAMLAADQIRALADRVGFRVVGGAGKWMKNSLANVGERAKDAAARVAPRIEAAAPTVRKVAVPTTIAAFQGKHKDLETAYEAKANQLLSVKQDPQALLERVATMTGGLHSIDPDLAAELIGKSQTAIDFLVSKLPSGTIDPTPLSPNRKAIVPRLEISRYARIWEAVERPMSVVEDLQRGQATPGQIEALAVCHPETLKAIRATVYDELLKAAQKGINVPLVMRQQLDLLLDLGGAGEPALGPDISGRVLALQAAAAKQQPQKPTTKKTPDLAKHAALPQSKWPSA